jgi:hypothetical protein
MGLTPEFATCCTKAYFLKKLNFGLGSVGPRL